MKLRRLGPGVYEVPNMPLIVARVERQSVGRRWDPAWIVRVDQHLMIPTYRAWRARLDTVGLMDEAMGTLAEVRERLDRMGI